MLAAQKSTLAILFTALMLSACGADKPGNLNTQLSDILYTDLGVEVCVNKSAEYNGWKTLADVTELRCDKTGKSHSSSPEDGGIWDTRDLEQFVYLENLDISGNYYSEFDPSSLIQLKQLTMEMSFIKTLDLSQNLKLEAIDVSSTPLTELDLSHNPAMRVIRATATAINSDIYQDGIMEYIDDILANDGLPNSWGDEIRQLSTEIIATRPLHLTIHSSAPIELLRVLQAAVIEYVD